MKCITKKKFKIKTAQYLDLSYASKFALILVGIFNFCNFLLFHIHQNIYFRFCVVLIRAFMLSDCESKSSFYDAHRQNISSRREDA